MRLFAPNVKKMLAKRDVKGLVEALNDKDTEIRRTAAEALGQLRAIDALPELVAAYKDYDQYVRYAVVESLGLIGTPQVLATLAAALKDMDPLVRSGAAQYLGKIGDPRTIKPLVTALKDNDSNVRWYAVEALGPFCDERVIPYLIPLLKDGNLSVQKAVISTLVRLGLPAVNYLVQALSESTVTQVEMIEALGIIGEPGAIPVLVRSLEENNFLVRKAAADALDRIKWTPRNDETGARYWIARDQWYKCIEIGLAAVKPLIEVIQSGRPELCKPAMETIGKIGVPVTEPLLAALNNPYPEIRRVGIETLNKLEITGIEGMMINLLKDSDLSVRQAAAAALDRLGWQPGTDENAAYYWITKTDWMRCIEIGEAAVEPLIHQLDSETGKYEASRVLRAMFDSPKTNNDTRDKIRIHWDKITLAWRSDDSLAIFNDQSLWR